MSASDDDRKQRFRFHKDDEILLLEIVLRADPCPYKITARDGTIMLAWNSVAEKFQSLCKPRPDGKIPHPRTCRTRTDKMITDYMARRAASHLKPQKQESKEDKIKNSLIAKLAAIQGKIELQPGELLDTSGVTIESTSTTGSGSGSGPSDFNTPAHLLAQSSSSTTVSHHQQQQQQHRGSGGLVATTLMPQTLPNIGGNGHHRMSHGQSTSELLAASGLMLANAGVSGNGLHSSHHQNTTSSDLFSAPSSNAHSQQQGGIKQKAVAARKRRDVGNSMATTANTTQASTNYLQRSAPTHTDHHTIAPVSKRLRSGASVNQDRLSIAPNSYDQQSVNRNNGTNNNNNSNLHHSNHTRSFLGGMGTNLGSNLSGQDLARLSGVGNGAEGDENDGDSDNDDESDAGGNDNGGYQHDQDDFGNDYDDGYQPEESDYANQPDASALLSLQNSTSLTIGNNRNGKGLKTPSSSSKGAGHHGKSSTMNNYGRDMRSSPRMLQMRPKSGGKSDSSFLGGSGALNAGYFTPSQLNAEDRAYLMRTLALEEDRVKAEVEKIALERERLALEREQLALEKSRLQLQVRQMNQ